LKGGSGKGRVEMDPKRLKRKEGRFELAKTLKKKREGKTIKK